MGSKTILNMGGKTNITLFGVGYTLEEIDVFQKSLPPSSIAFACFGNYGGLRPSLLIAFASFGKKTKTSTYTHVAN